MNALRTLAGAALLAALAVLLLASPASSITPPNPEGDANCDGIVNSIDATLILQVDAGLIDTVPCTGGADVNLDGAINSLDAAIILQMGAGLCCNRPLTATLTIDILPLGDILPFGVPYGESLALTLSITNSSDRQVERTYNSGQRYDFVVLDGTGTEVWRWSHGLFFTQAIVEVTFEPGETATYGVIWNQTTNNGEQVGPGSYVLHAFDVGCGMPPARQCGLDATHAFEILPPPQ